MLQEKLHKIKKIVTNSNYKVIPYFYVQYSKHYLTDYVTDNLFTSIAIT